MYCISIWLFAVLKPHNFAIFKSTNYVLSIKFIYILFLLTFKTTSRHLIKIKFNFKLIQV